jgi:hypothetical protein
MQWCTGLLVFVLPAPASGRAKKTLASPAAPPPPPSPPPAGVTGQSPGGTGGGGVSSPPRSVVVARAAAVGGGTALGVGRGGVAVLRRRGGCAVLGGLAAVVVSFDAAAGVACWVPLPAAVMQRRRCSAGGGAWQLGLHGGAGGRGSSGAGRWRGAAWMQQCVGGADWA